VYSSVPTLGGEIRATAVRLFAYICGIAGIAVLAAELFQSAPVVAAVEPAERPDWMTIARPAPAFEAHLPELSEEARYSIQRHVRGGGRKDILTFGEPGRSTRYVMLEIYRPGTELSHFADPADEIAARSGALGAAGDVRVSLPIDSKFGKMDTVDFAVGHFGGGHCIGFVRNFNAPRLQISGLSCNMDMTIVDRGALRCMLDRLTLLSSGSDRNVAEVFARAEVNRKFCGQRDPLMYATPKRPGSAENAAPLKLRGSFASR
jgi:hypothetical protein